MGPSAPAGMRMIPPCFICELASRSLCEHYDHILIPKFHCYTIKCFLHRTSTRQLVPWSHFQFCQRLKHKANELGAKVSEHSTYITCSRCLWIEESFKGNSSKTFECWKCGLHLDWDRNRACNILLMNVERHVGRLEPYLLPAITTSPQQQQPPSREESLDDSDDYKCQGWMWGDGLRRARRRGRRHMSHDDNE